MNVPAGENKSLHLMKIFIGNPYQSILTSKTQLNLLAGNVCFRNDAISIKKTNLWFIKLLKTANEQWAAEIYFNKMLTKVECGVTTRLLSNIAAKGLRETFEINNTRFKIKF